ncbi:GntR family transcriptional regulator [Paractinoplanes brasiliensis]|uniref:DNA-binding GntR family transcriptional regulator n=1 Tax=Paractinoplanes brasiliensis TaxID=52695 RepID=A0A4V3C6B8_9ACTN|nr:GntR family transcriptional regulator [Actinoplanes brasiliensis]TDO33148.1 DNA-binding GntR family transcriptional regulator [Actinoplanes brasiliensis]GID28865.1 putative transcriptional regulator, GntR family protein [Actinoplanes brasiliensis]
MPIPRGESSVDRSLLRDDVYRRLRDAIVDGTFLPGEQLKDGELAEWLGVSRTPVREALLRLAAGGLVVTTPGKSTRVSLVDAQSVRDARDVIAAMHELAVRQTAGRLSDDELDRMRAANRRFAEAVTSGDVAAALDADEAIHRVPVDASGNRALMMVLDQFDPLVRRAERLRFSTDGHASVELHDRLIEMMAARDAEGAASVAFDIWHTLPAEEDDTR